MERVVVVGNCQAKALEMMLSTSDAFAERFEFVSFPAVHEIPAEMIPQLHEAVANAAVLLTQRVTETYRDSLGLGTDTLARIANAQAAVIRWPSLYWAGYFPDLFYLRGPQGELVVDGPFDYHDRSLLEAYGAGLEIAETCRLLADPDRPSEAVPWAESATTELDVRGAGCDIQVASFIGANFRDEFLFFTMNHPTNRLLGQLAQQVIELLEIPGKIEAQRINDEILGPTFYPLHANHVHALELSFSADVVSGTTPFKIRGVSYTPEEAACLFFDYYDANQHLVEINLALTGSPESPET